MGVRVIHAISGLQYVPITGGYLLVSQAGGARPAVEWISENGWIDTRVGNSVMLSMDGVLTKWSRLRITSSADTLLHSGNSGRPIPASGVF